MMYSISGVCISVRYSFLLVIPSWTVLAVGISETLYCYNVCHYTPFVGIN